jgi:hypothetical protein
VPATIASSSLSVAVSSDPLASSSGCSGSSTFCGSIPSSAAAAGSARRAAHRRNLSERQVLVEPFRGQPFDATCQQREERAAGGIGATRAAVEVDRHITARAGVLEEAEILPWRAQQHRHLVEAHAPRRFVEDAPDDFHRFTPFAGGREHTHVACPLARRWRVAAEDVAAQAGEIRFAPCGVCRLGDHPAHRREGLERAAIIVRNGGEDVRRRANQRGGELLLRERIDRDVEQHERPRCPSHLTGPARLGREAEQPCAIVHAALHQLRLDARQEDRQIGAEARGRHTGESQFVDRARERFRKSREASDRRKVCELVGGNRVEHCARRHGFHAGARSRHAPCAGQSRCGGPGCDLGEAESRQAKGGASAPRDVARQIVSRPAGRADDDDFGSWEMSGEKTAGGFEADGGRRREDDAHHRAPSGRHAGQCGRGSARCRAHSIAELGIGNLEFGIRTSLDAPGVIRWH